MSDSQQLLVMIILGFTLLVDLWAVGKVISRPSYAFSQAGKSKTLWLVMLLVTILLFNFGFLVSVWYLFMVDPKVRGMQKLGPGYGFPGGT